MPSQNSLKQALEKVSRIRSATERAVSVAAVIAEALRTVHQDPVLVGGSAVTFYTQGRHATADIDMVAEGGPDLIRTMSELGFKKIGKDFVQKKLKLYVEFPSRDLKPSERTDRIRVGQRELRIISIEDLIVDRLCAFKFWQSAIDGINALMLLEQAGIDEDRLLERSTEEDVRDALQAVREAGEQTIRKRLPKREANQLLEQKMRELKRR